MLVKYTKELQTVWDKAVQENNNATFMFFRHFMEYHPEGKFNEHSVIVDDNFLFPATTISEIVSSHTGLSYAGLISPKGVKLTRYLKVFYELLMYYKNLGYATLLYKQTPSFYCQENNGAEDYALFLANAYCHRRDSNVILDLNKKPEFSERKKRNIKRGFENKLYTKVINEDKDYDEYWNKILIPCLKNKHGVDPTHSLNEILKLKKIFSHNIFLECVYHNNEMTGGVVWFENRDVSHSQYIANTEECTKVGGLDYLFSNFISHNKGRILSFGVCNEEQGAVLNRGLSDWKQEFGAEIVTHNFYKIDLTQDFYNLKRNV